VSRALNIRCRSLFAALLTDRHRAIEGLIMAEVAAVPHDGQLAPEEPTLDYLAMKRNPSKERTANLAGLLPAFPLPSCLANAG